MSKFFWGVIFFYHFFGGELIPFIKKSLTYPNLPVYGFSKHLKVICLSVQCSPTQFEVSNEMFFWYIMINAAANIQSTKECKWIKNNKKHVMAVMPKENILSGKEPIFIIGL